MKARSRLKQKSYEWKRYDFVDVRPTERRRYDQEKKMAAFIGFLFGIYISVVTYLYLSNMALSTELRSLPENNQCREIMCSGAVEVSGGSDTREEVVRLATITAYSCGGLKTEAEIKMNCPSLLTGSPKTANGTEPIPYATMACDRANMGRTFWLDINGGIKVVCTDRGSAINGYGRFDLYLPTVQEAREWGVQTREYKELVYLD